MRASTVALLSTGDMGHVVGGVLADKGFRVITSLEDRSGISRMRAERVGIQDVGSLGRIVEESDYILSIMPPENAVEFARKVSKVMQNLDFAPVFADCNAVSPTSTHKINEMILEAKAEFVKVGIVGPPPRPGVTTRFYASGPYTDRLSFLEGNGISYRPLGNDITKAASLKMCYAGLNKGTNSLHAAVLIAAELLGVRQELAHELAVSQKFHWDLMNRRIPSAAADAGRWSGEMEEISETFCSVGVSENLHKGAAEIFSLLDGSPLGDETRETIDKSRTLDETIKIFSDTIRMRHVAD